MNPALTKQQAIYRNLKDRIMSGVLPPGQRLIIDEIAAAMGLSIIPVREALQLLQSERLVEIRPHAGATVSPITPQDIEEVFTILEGVEAVAVRRIATRRPPGLEATLAELIRLMAVAEKGNNVERWTALNVEFHLAMCEATGMPWLQEITSRALESWDRIRRHFFRKGAVHQFSEAAKQHRALLEAIRSGNADTAEKLIRRHNRDAFQHYSQLPTTNSNRPGRYSSAVSLPGAT